MRRSLIALALLAACSDATGSAGIAPGEFDATVTGAVSIHLRGTAVSGPVNPTLPQDRIILRAASGDEVLVQLAESMDLQAGRTSIGDILDSEAFGAVFVGEREFRSTNGGSLQLDQVSAAGVEGHLEFDAV